MPGNHCGHDPAAPRLYQPGAAAPRRPRIIRATQEALAAWWADRDLIPGLRHADRHTRSERREACLALLGAMLERVDLASLRVGRPRSDPREVDGIPLAELADAAGLELRRAERACRDLRRAGLITSHPRAERPPGGEWRALPAIRRIAAELWDCLGLGRWLSHERRRASRRRLRRLTAALSPRQAARAALTLRGALGHLEGPAGGALLPLRPRSRSP